MINNNYLLQIKCILTVVEVNFYNKNNHNHLLITIQIISKKNEF